MFFKTCSSSISSSSAACKLKCETLYQADVHMHLSEAVSQQLRLQDSLRAMQDAGAIAPAENGGGRGDLSIARRGQTGDEDVSQRRHSNRLALADAAASCDREVMVLRLHIAISVIV